MWGQGRLTLPQDLVLSQELVGNSVGHSVGQRGGSTMVAQQCVEHWPLARAGVHEPVHMGKGSGQVNSRQFGVKR